MKKLTMIAVDLAKNVFQLHGVDEKGNKLLSRRLTREKFRDFITSHEPTTFAMETCSGANYWARQCMLAGHEVRLISPQYVKPFVKTNKNDATDVEAIAEAAGRPNMRFAQPKPPEQLDIQAIHRVRNQSVRRRTAIANEIRGHLAEYGIVIPKSVHTLRKKVPHIVDDLENDLTMMARDYISDLYADMLHMDERIAKYDRTLEKWAEKNENCQRLMGVPGIGLITSTIICAAAGDGTAFKNGRHFAAWLGLTPRQHSSGGRDRHLGISKHGDRYIRTLLIQGAHNLVRRSATPWIRNLVERRGYNRACVAQANKTARIAWAVLARKEAYRAA